MRARYLRLLRVIILACGVWLSPYPALAGLTFIGSATGTDNASGTTLDTSSTLNVATGDLLVVWVRWESTTATPTAAETGGGNGMTMLASVSNSVWGALGYRLSATAMPQRLFDLPSMRRGPFAVLSSSNFGRTRARRSHLTGRVAPQPGRAPL